MKYESSKTEASFALLCANLQVVAVSAFAQYELQIAGLTKELEKANKKLKELDPGPEGPSERNPREIIPDPSKVIGE